MQTTESDENCGVHDTGVFLQVTSKDARDGSDYAFNQLWFVRNSCSSTSAQPIQPHNNVSDVSDSSPPSTQWHVSIRFQKAKKELKIKEHNIMKNISRNEEGENQITGTLGCPDTYENMMERMSEIEKTLAAIKETVTRSSVCCHLLNVDVVTMFSPETVDTLNKTMEQCDCCMKRMKVPTADFN